MSQSAWSVWVVSVPLVVKVLFNVRIVTVSLTIFCLLISGRLWAETVVVGTQRFQVTVAKTPDDYHTGLMHRQRLKKYEGMWFPFQPAHPVAFWMKNCLIPLDFIYIRNAKIVEILPDRPPCTIEGETCPSYPSHGDVDAVLEVTGGTAVKYRWQPGLIILLKNKN